MIDFELIYTKDEDKKVVIEYLDNDLAGNVEDRKSTSGMVFYINKSLITWNSQKQRCFAFSSSEVEFMAAIAASCPAV